MNNYKLNEVMPKHEFKNKMERIAYFDAEDVVNLITECHNNGVRKGKINDFPWNVNISTGRLKNFALNGCTCVKCGCKGVLFVLERNLSKNKDNKQETPHFNLYAIKDNKYVLMTKDHIFPN